MSSVRFMKKQTRSGLRKGRNQLNIFNFFTKNSMCFISIFMGLKQIDITNQKFGMLTAIRWVRNEKGKRKKTGEFCYFNYWEFKCDCGNIKVLRKSRVKPICKSSIKSCGCLVAIKNRERNTKGYMGISGCQWSVVKRGARNRGIKFKLTLKEAWEVFEKQNGLCNLSGEKLYFSSVAPYYKGTTASLDRINSDIGYIKENIQWVHKYINIMKWDLTQNEFIEWCKKVNNNNI